MVRYLFFVLFLLLSFQSFAQDSIGQKSRSPKVVVHEPTYDDANWEWGIFYFCRDDKRMFPPKPNGMGWTINFANAKAIMITVFGAILIFGF